ncbi:MAG: hypothetical protein J0H41_13220 [Rhizobiales bacterium]|nr:hypothetical protein [Hyphomicrobiales bacterium]
MRRWQKTLAMAQLYSESADMSDKMEPKVIRMNVLAKKQERKLSTRATV